MKKSLVHQINVAADMVPERWEKQNVTVNISGADANLCVVGKSPYDPHKNYEFQQPVFLKVPHRERMKDGVKQFGPNYIGTYLNQILAR